MRYPSRVAVLLVALASGCDRFYLSQGEYDSDVKKRCEAKRNKFCKDDDKDGHGAKHNPERPPVEVCDKDNSAKLEGDFFYYPCNPGDCASDQESEQYWTNCDDSDDADSTVNPDAPDCAAVPDYKDNDQDGTIDNTDGAYVTCSMDGDGDGFCATEVVCGVSCDGDDDTGNSETTCDNGSEPIECDDDPSISVMEAEAQCADNVDSDCDGNLECAVYGSEGRILLTDGVSKLSVAGSSIDSVGMVPGRGYIASSDGTVSQFEPDTSCLEDGGTFWDCLALSPVGSPTTAFSKPQIVVSSNNEDVMIGDAGSARSCLLDGAEQAVADEDCYTLSSAIEFGGAVLAQSSTKWVGAYIQCDASPQTMYWRLYFFLNAPAPDITPSIAADLGDSSKLAYTGATCDTSSLGTLRMNYFGNPSSPALGMVTPDSAGDDSLFVALGSQVAGSDNFSVSCDPLSVGALVISDISCPDGSGDMCLTTLSADLTVDVWNIDTSEDSCVSIVASVEDSQNGISATSISSAGDVNGDGYDDLLVGSTGAAYLYLRWEDSSGKVGYGTPYGPDGAPTNDPYTTITDSATSDKPYEVFGDADLNGDGYSDFGVLVNGTLYLFAGGPP